MKMKKEHIDRILTSANKEGCGLLADKYKEQGLSKTRFVWDYFHAVICKNDPSLSRELTSYLNDSHIDTVLNKLVKY